MSITRRLVLGGAWGILGATLAAAGARSRSQGRGLRPGVARFDLRNLRLDPEETRALWDDTRGWVLSGLHAVASRTASLGIELWDPRVSLIDPLLWCEVELVEGEPTDLIVGCEFTFPHRIRVLRSTDAGVRRVAGGLLPESSRPRVDSLAEAWGGSPRMLEDGWSYQGFHTIQNTLETAAKFATASWNGPGTNTLLLHRFWYPDPRVSGGGSWVLGEEEREQPLLDVPLQRWPQPAWVWCAVSDWRR